MSISRLVYLVDQHQSFQSSASVLDQCARLRSVGRYIDYRPIDLSTISYTVYLRILNGGVCFIPQTMYPSLQTTNIKSRVQEYQSSLVYLVLYYSLYSYGYPVPGSAVVLLYIIIIITWQHQHQCQCQCYDSMIP